MSCHVIYVKLDFESYGGNCAMNITTFSDYTLRVLIYLAVHDGCKSTADEIAKAYDISFHHVAKAAQWLVREGYVKSERGRFGGIRLNQHPREINIGHIVKATEAGTILVDCLRETGGACCIRPACGLKGALAQAQIEFYKVLEGYSLADVAQKDMALKALLAGD